VGRGVGLAGHDLFDEAAEGLDAGADKALETFEAEDEAAARRVA
jgi:hypothetical protein